MAVGKTRVIGSPCKFDSFVRGSISDYFRLDREAVRQVFNV